MSCHGGCYSYCCRTIFVCWRRKRKDEEEGRSESYQCKKYILKGRGREVLTGGCERRMWTGMGVDQPDRWTNTAASGRSDYAVPRGAVVSLSVPRSSSNDQTVKPINMIQRAVVDVPGGGRRHMALMVLICCVHTICVCVKKDNQGIHNLAV